MAATGIFEQLPTAISRSSKLLSSYNFLYLDSCRAAQIDGFGPLFLNLGLDEVLSAVREAMRDLNVDITGSKAKASHVVVRIIISRLALL